MSLAGASAASGVSPSHLRRLCAAGAIPCERAGTRWRVRLGDVRRYLASRRRPGRQPADVAYQGTVLSEEAVRYAGEARNPELRDATPLQFAVALADGPRDVVIWISRNLELILAADGRDAFDLVRRASHRLIIEELLRHDALPTRHDVFLSSSDRVRLLRASGVSGVEYLPSEAPLEEGVVVIYDHTARDGDWPGDRLHWASVVEWPDVVVTTTPDAGRRRVRTVRMSAHRVGLSRRANVLAAITACARRAARLGVPEPEWMSRLREQIANLHPEIVSIAAEGGPRPALSNRPRLGVADIIETWLACGRDVAETARYFDLSVGEVNAAIAYYADFKDDVDRLIERKQGTADRLEEVMAPGPGQT